MGNGAKVGLVGVLALIVLVVAVWDKSHDAGKKGAPGMTVNGADPGTTAMQPAGDPSVRVLPRVPQQGDRVTGSLEPGLQIGRTPTSGPVPGPAPARAVPGLEPVARPPQPVTPAPAAVATPPAAPAARPVARRTYKIKETDTLSSIALEHLGAKSRWREIYDANRDRLSSPDSLVVGLEIAIPERPAERPASGPVAGSPAAAPRAPSVGAAATTLAASYPPPPPGARTHTVARGDTLSTIAEKYYGARTKWHKVFLANKERLPDPDRLQEGMLLVIPD